MKLNEMLMRYRAGHQQNDVKPTSAERNIDVFGSFRIIIIFSVSHVPTCGGAHTSCLHECYTVYVYIVHTYILLVY